MFPLWEAGNSGYLVGQGWEWGLWAWFQSIATFLY